MRDLNEYNKYLLMRCLNKRKKDCPKLVEKNFTENFYALSKWQVNEIMNLLFIFKEEDDNVSFDIIIESSIPNIVRNEKRKDSENENPNG
jgi:hypothetical protein